MSGIYIPMEMPKNCDDCDLMTVEGEYGEPTCPFGRIIRCASERHPDCPLVPVPEHGRLIDADALDDILADQSEGAYNRTHAPRSWERALSVMRDYLDDAPTIIPADKDGEG